MFKFIVNEQFLVQRVHNVDQTEVTVLQTDDQDLDQRHSPEFRPSLWHHYRSHDALLPPAGPESLTLYGLWEFTEYKLLKNKNIYINNKQEQNKSLQI